MKITLFASLFLLLPSHNLLAQEKQNYGLKLHYFGERIAHPGLSVGTEYSLRKNPWFNLHWDTELGFYFHKWNHSGLFANTSIGTRFTAPFAAFADLNLSAGYLHTFVQGNVYGSENGSDVVRQTDWGRPHFMPGLSLLFGWDGTKNRDLPFAISSGPVAFLQMPFNRAFLPHIAWKLGVTYYL